MPYIGKQLVRGQNRKLDDISSGFNGSQTTFTLQVASQNVTVGSALQLWISLGGVIQDPLSDYTIAGNQITFTTAPAASLDFFGVIQGDVTDTNTPGDATVTTSKLSTGLTVNLADGSAATSSLQLGGTDSGLFSSAADKVNVTTGGVERLEIGDSEVVFNDPSNDVDFRVESNGNANMLFVDGGNDRVGIGTSSPDELLHVANTGGGASILIETNASSGGNLLFGDNSSNTVGRIQYDHSGNSMRLHTNGSERLRIDSSGNLGIGVTSPAHELHVADASTPEIVVEDTTNNVKAYLGSSDSNGRVGTLSNHHFQLRTNDTERMRIDSSGNVSIGHAGTPDSLLTIDGNVITTAKPTVSIAPSSGNASIVLRGGSPTLSFDQTGGGDGTIIYDSGSDLLFKNGTLDSSSEVARINEDGILLIGSSTKATAGTAQYAFLQIAGNTAGTSGSVLDLKRGEAASAMSDGDSLGTIVFTGTTGGDFATILGSVDGSPSGSDFPGRIVFSTTADGANTPTERMRISSSGLVKITGANEANMLQLTTGNAAGNTFAAIRGDNEAGIRIVGGGSFPGGGIELGGGLRNSDPGVIKFYAGTASSVSERARLMGGGEFVVGKTSAGVASRGGELRDGNSDYAVVATANGHIPCIVNRNTNDGGLIRFRQDNSDEGDISISGSTVSYNGAHLSRWSQLAGGAERIEILRGSVLSNLDEMCEWGEENNEQLNRMKVSDVEGDPNVSGVFQGWDDDDDTYTNDFYCAMTGDFVIRIAQGTTVARGDLLMSAGDGTAKPQDDDIVRSKTIAKVTSTTVSTTYADGSYCVPCVLMAC